MTSERLAIRRHALKSEGLIERTSSHCLRSARALDHDAPECRPCQRGEKNAGMTSLSSSPPTRPSRRRAISANVLHMPAPTRLSSLAPTKRGGRGHRLVVKIRQLQGRHETMQDRPLPSRLRQRRVRAPADPVSLAPSVRAHRRARQADRGRRGSDSTRRAPRAPSRTGRTQPPWHARTGAHEHRALPGPEGRSSLRSPGIHPNLSGRHCRDVYAPPRRSAHGRRVAPTGYVGLTIRGPVWVLAGRRRRVRTCLR